MAATVNARIVQLGVYGGTSRLSSWRGVSPSGVGTSISLSTRDWSKLGALRDGCELVIGERKSMLHPDHVGEMRRALGVRLVG